jgi:hypothetical protein
MVKYKTIIGRAEVLDFPELLLADIPVKTDTGAYSSSIHATEINEQVIKGKKVLSFNLMANHPVYPYSREMKVTNYDKKVIENSFGHKQERFVIELKVKIGGKIFKADFSLADRSSKPFPVLLGRTLLNKRFLVDSSLSNIDRRELKATLKKWTEKNEDADEDLV